MHSCGLWYARRRLVAVVVDSEGRASPAIAAAQGEDSRWGLFARLDAIHGFDFELVITEQLAKDDCIGHTALARSIPVWVAPQRLIDAIRAAAALATGPPARTAAMIARLAVVPTWRSHLRRVGQEPDRRQLPLF